MYSVKDYYTGQTLVTLPEYDEARRYAQRFDGMYVVDDNGDTVYQNVSFPF